MRFFCRKRRVLNTLRHDKDFARSNAYVAIAQPHDHLALQDEEKSSVSACEYQEAPETSPPSIMAVERANDTPASGLM
jgi:hypothetical protein